ncbi:MAG: hypothetical protein H3C50_11380 [Kiritimatiellae bacterium]|nr:hypothetical protein [Kiritimatiellia bacterium]MCO5045027.1 DUF6132 family protein [Kiritimatiellia bacterium]MCO5062595.1 DUF6132 family protein [Kiritimatiellia bacterium]MCO5068715.1 DUF6132 family protein [Kiritimatiellia bacterium]MCO6400648.1 hypothetical protein [Verrucomicrobiota bacterium]
MSQTLWKPVLGALIGAGIGFALYRFVGCKTGACPITASPWSSILVYGLLGALMFSGR